MNNRLFTSSRSEMLIQSEIRNMSIECDNVGGINLSQGVCDLPLPDAVRQGAHLAIDEGFNTYTRYDGLQELREAIAKKAVKYNAIQCDPNKNIIVSAGATGALYSACLALLDPGDEVIIFEPYYGYHINTFNAAGVVSKYVKLKPPSWTFNIEEVEKAITPKTRGIMINTPANPSGKVFTREELKSLAELCNRYDLFVFTDEIYEYFLYDNGKHISPASMQEFNGRTITISGYSKTFSITGWRIGYCICDERWSETIGYVNDLVYVCGPAPLQMGVAKGINDLSDGFYSAISREYQEKRDRLCSVLKKIGLTPYVPQGAYYVLADVSSIAGATSKEKAMSILKKTGVASVPGSAFYHADGGDNLVRFCFAKKDPILNEACERLLSLKR